MWSSNLNDFGMDLKMAIMAFNWCKKCINWVKSWEITMELSWCTTLERVCWTIVGIQHMKFILAVFRQIFQKWPFQITFFFSHNSTSSIFSILPPMCNLFIQQIFELPNQYLMEHSRNLVHDLTNTMNTHTNTLCSINTWIKIVKSYCGNPFVPRCTCTLFNTKGKNNTNGVTKWRIHKYSSTRNTKST